VASGGEMAHSMAIACVQSVMTSLTGQLFHIFHTSKTCAPIEISHAISFIEYDNPCGLHTLQWKSEKRVAETNERRFQGHTTTLC